jgi:hypothetical protein
VDVEAKAKERAVVRLMALCHPERSEGAMRRVMAPSLRSG